MVVCPFVYLQMRYDLPPLALQPSEVHSAHWVPLMGLLSPSLRKEVRCDVSDRFRGRTTPFMKMALRAVLGQLVFGAVQLKPTETLYSNRILEGDLTSTSFGSRVANVLKRNQSDPDEQPLLLWGLTLGIMGDLLELIDRPATSKLWSWPTFSPWDIRIVIWLLNRRFQSRKIRELTITSTPGTPQTDDIRIDGLDNTTYSTSVKRQMKGSEAGIAGMMLLAGYTDRLRGAVVVALLMRLAFGTALSTYWIRRYRGHSSRIVRG